MPSQIRNSRNARILLLVAGATLGIGLSEASLRVVGFTSPNFYRSDMHTGFALREGAEGWWTIEGRSYVAVSRDGLRDREHPKQKPAGTFRIAVLGDSYAEAMQVPEENAFWRVMEGSLQSCQAFHGQRIEVVNFGVGGFGTAQELQTLRHRAWAYSPNLVLLAFLSGNDVRNNLRALEGDPMRPYFVYHDNGLVLDASFRESRGFRFRESVMRRGGYWLLDHVRTLQALSEAARVIRDWRTLLRQTTAASDTAQKTSGAQPRHEMGLEPLTYLEPTDPLWEEAWRVTEGLIVQMRNEVRAKGADFLVATLTNGDQVGPDPLQRSAYARDLGAPDLLYPERRINRLGVREGISVLNLAQPFAAYAEKQQVVLHGFENAGRGHWNARGHRLAGTLIADTICSNHATPH